MTGQRQDVVCDDESLQRVHRDSSQVLIAQRKNTRQVSGGRKKQLLPTRSRFGAKFLSIASEKKAGSTWPETTFVVPALEDVSKAVKDSTQEEPACSKCYKIRKPGQKKSASKSEKEDQASHEESGMDKARSKAYEELARCLKGQMGSTKQLGHDEVSGVIRALKALQGPESKQNLAKKDEALNLSAIPKLSDFSEKADLKAYLNPEQEAPAVRELPVDTARTNLDSSTSKLDDPSEINTQKPIPVTSTVSRPCSPVAHSEGKALEKNWSHDKHAETTIKVLEQEIQALQQENARMMEEIVLVQKQTASNLKYGGNRVPFAEGMRNPELEIALAFRQQALAKHEFDEKLAAAKVQHERDSNIVQKEISTRKAELDAREEALLQREQNVEIREHRAAADDRLNATGEAVVPAQGHNSSVQRQDSISRDLTARLRGKSASRHQPEALARGEEEQRPTYGINGVPKSRILPLRELNHQPTRSEAPTGLHDAVPSSFDTRMHDGVRTDRDSHGVSLEAHNTQAKQGKAVKEQQEMLAATVSFRSLLDLKRRTKDGIHEFSDTSCQSRISQSPGHLVEKSSEDTPTFQHTAFTDHAGTKRKTENKATPRRSSAPAQPEPASSIPRNTDNGQANDYDDSAEEDDDSDDGNAKRRKGVPSKPTSQQRSLACPYSKYNIGRYSQMNLTEKQYSGCLKCIFPDISRLKQHLYRVHKRPDNHCLRCFEVFRSGELLDQHSQQNVSCNIRKCPFPEKFNQAQMGQLKKKGTGKSAEQCWFIIFRILFPEAKAPASPYTDDLHLLSPDAPQVLRQMVFERLFQHQHSPTTELLLSDEVQKLLGQTIEDSLTELFRTVTPISNSNTQPSPSRSNGHAFGDHITGDHETDDNESDVQDPDSEQIVKDHCHRTQPNSEDTVALPTMAMENQPSNSDFTYSQHSRFDNAVNFDIGEYGLLNNFHQPETYRSEAFHRVPENSALSSYQPFNQQGELYDYNNRSPQNLGSLVGPPPGYDNFHLNNQRHTWSGTSPANHVPVPAFSIPELRGATSDPAKQRSSSHAGCCKQQLPQKGFEPSIRSFDSGYRSMSSQQGSFPSFGGSSENIAISTPGLYDTSAGPWGPNNTDETEFCEGARKSSRLSAFAESRTTYHPAATF